MKGDLGFAPISQGDDCNHNRFWSCISICRMGLAVVLPFSRRADPGGAECMMMLSKAKIVLVFPVPGGPCMNSSSRADESGMGAEV
jgi:hypothetical protein